MGNKRVCIYAKDISALLGKSYAQSLRIMKTIKDAYGKTDKQYLTMEEFAEYTGIKIETVRKQCLP